MSDLLADALQLTLLGMGMTFLSLGALVAGMFLLTRVTRPQTDVGDGGDGGEGGLEGDALVVDGEGMGGLAMQPELVTGDDAEERRRAAAAAVAVSLALQVPARGRAILTPLDGGAYGESAWNTYARGLHLSSRARYESLRGRR